MPKSRPLRSLDLLSGIGGLSLALLGFAVPIAYCDIDPSSRAVLHDNVNRGRLPKAPINSDICTLNKKWMRDNVRSAPEAIVAGFPCIGFSSAGKREGFENSDSFLFFEIMRIIDENSTITAVFLENVPNLLKVGMPAIVHELHIRRKFNLRWCIVAARDVGAPHLRRRWFCVALRGENSIPNIPQEAAWLKTQWDKFKPKRTIGSQTTQEITKKDVIRNAGKRARLLGNAVVPHAARHAFSHLLHLKTICSMNATRLPLGNMANLIWPQSGAVQNKSLCALPSPHRPNFRPPLPIHLDAKCYKPPRGYIGKNCLQPLVGQVSRPYWATPRPMNTVASQVMTERTSHDLPTQIRYEQDTPDDARSCHVAPEFLEWLMGYPKGWTAAAFPLV